MDRYSKLQVLVYSVTPSHTSTCIIWNSLHNHLCFNLHSNAKRSDNLSSASIGAEQFKNTLTSERVVNFTHKDWEKNNFSSSLESTWAIQEVLCALWLIVSLRNCKPSSKLLQCTHVPHEFFRHWLRFIQKFDCTCMC